MNSFEKLKAGTAQIIPEQELQEKLASGKKLRIKLGMDPTASDLHLGHAITLSKLREFQELGHEVIFLVGDFTARIGDPTGRSKTRPPLTEVDIARNMQTYLAQVGKILNPKNLIIEYNSTWLDKLSSKEMVKLCAHVTLARLTEREDFATRIENNVSIAFHELLYPLFQGYDSVHLHADVELGGTDQTFNLLMGRLLQEQYGQERQVIITMPLLRGLDGVNKMSKSLGNAIGIAEEPEQAYGKLMSISDELMWHYYEVLLCRQTQEVQTMQAMVAAEKAHPMELKKKMAHDVIAKFWSPQQATQAQENFQALFQQKDYSKAREVSLPENTPNPLWIADLLKLLNAVESSSQAKRLIEEGAVFIDSACIKDFKAQIDCKKGTLIKVGKYKIFTLT